MVLYLEKKKSAFEKIHPIMFHLLDTSFSVGWTAGSKEPVSRGNVYFHGIFLLLWFGYEL